MADPFAAFPDAVREQNGRFVPVPSAPAAPSSAAPTGATSGDPFASFPDAYRLPSGRFSAEPVPANDEQTSGGIANYKAGVTEGLAGMAAYPGATAPNLSEHGDKWSKSWEDSPWTSAAAMGGGSPMAMPIIPNASTGEMNQAGTDWLVKHGLTDPSKVQSADTVDSIMRAFGRGTPSLPLSLLGPGGLTGGGARSLLGQGVRATTGVAGGAALGEIARENVPDRWKGIAELGGNIAGGGVAGLAPDALAAPFRQANRLWRGPLGMGKMEDVQTPAGPYKATQEQQRMVSKQIHDAAEGNQLQNALNNPGEGAPLYPGESPTTAETVARSGLASTATEQALAAQQRLARKTRPDIFNGEIGGRQADIAALQQSAPAGTDPGAVGTLLGGEQQAQRQEREATLNTLRENVAGATQPLTAEGTVPGAGMVNTVPAWNEASKIAQDFYANERLRKLDPNVKDVLTRFLGKATMANRGVEIESALEGADAPIPERQSFRQSRELLSQVGDALHSVPPTSDAAGQLSKIHDALVDQMAKIDRPATVDAVRTGLTSNLRKGGVITPEGQVDMGKLATWRAQPRHASILAKFPEVDQLFKNAEAAQDNYNTVLATQKAEGEIHSDKVASAFIAGDPKAAVNAAMSGPNGPQKLSALVQQIQAAKGADPKDVQAAMYSLQRHVTDWLVDKFTTGKFPTDTGMVATDIQKTYNDFLTKYKAPLIRLGADGKTGGGQWYNNLYAVGKSMRAEQEVRSMENAAGAEQPGMLGKLGRQIGKHGASPWTIGGMGLLLAEHLGGEGGLATAAGGVGAGVLKHWYDTKRQASLTSMAGMHALAMRYPDVMRALPSPTAAPNGMALKRLTAAVHAAVVNDIMRQTAVIGQ